MNNRHVTFARIEMELRMYPHLEIWKNSAVWAASCQKLVSVPLFIVFSALELKRSNFTDSVATISSNSALPRAKHQLIGVGIGQKRI